MLYIQGFWQVVEEKAKFVGFLGNFQGKLHWKAGKKQPILWLFSR